MNSAYPLRARTWIVLAAALTASAISSAEAQNQLVRTLGTDSVIVIAGPNFKAGSLHRYFLGDEYRDVWTTPIKVPVLDLRSFHGGLRPVKEGGGMQAKSLRLVAPDSSEYVFRLVRKTKTFLGPEYDGTIISWIVRDQGAASHPAAADAAAPMLRAADVLHPSPKLFFMPDDPLLGQYRKDFAGLLGMVEEYPSVPKKGRAFADADKIIDSQDLLDRINKDSENPVAARDFLTARMMDLLLGDNDRHPDQWAWARLGKPRQGAVGANPAGPRQGVRLVRGPDPRPRAPRGAESRQVQRASIRIPPRCSPMPANSTGGCSEVWTRQCGIRSRPV